MDKTSLKEVLAQTQHEIWSHWMSYQFSQCTFNENGDAIIPNNKVARWKRQLNTPYECLSEAERESDLNMADVVINNLKEYYESKET